MHALRALSQGAPAGRRVRRRDMLQKEDAPPRRKETRPHEGKETVDNAGRKGGGRRPATTPEHRRGGCIRGRGALDAEIESRRLATCPCGWHQEHPGCTRGHGARQGAESTYNAPRGGGPGTLGHSPSAVGHVPWPIAIRHVEPGSLGMWNPSPGKCHPGGDL